MDSFRLFAILMNAWDRGVTIKEKRLHPS